MTRSDRTTPRLISLPRSGHLGGVLQPGDVAPDFVLPRLDGPPARLYGHVGGRPLLLVLRGSGPAAAIVAPLEPPPIDLVTILAPDTEVDPAPPGLALRDARGDVFAAYDAAIDAAATHYVLGPDLRVIAAWVDGTDPARMVRESLAALPRHEPRLVAAQAPVLLLPRVLEPERCRHLVELFHQHGSEQTGIEASVEDSRRNRHDDRIKRRRDHVVGDGGRRAELANAIGRRLMPEVEKAFAYRATRFEGFKIVCYDAADGAFFGPHRDNLSPATAHRRFALTLNLNDGYAGGELRFPEYGPFLHRPGPGGAVVFSASIMHEVLPVTSGRRFAVVSFLYS